MTKDDLKLDRPISGDITPSNRSSVPQISKEEFMDRLDAVLNLPKVKSVVWDQYTPYFNDGDECLFGIQEPRLILESDEEGDDQDALFGTGYREYYSGYTASELYQAKPGVGYDYWTGTYPNRTIIRSKVTFIAQDGTDLEPYFDALSAFSKTAEWEDVALTNFGDHATVTATTEGFSVDYYEHD